MPLNAWRAMFKPIIKFFCFSIFLFFSTLDGATLLVTNLNDTGAGTLRKAINNATPYDTIQFNSELAGTIYLNSPLPKISDSLTINGPSSQAVTIDGNGNSIFNIKAPFVTISKLNLSNGIRSKGGGAVVVNLNHTVTLDNLNITISEEADGLNPLLASLDGQINLSNVTFSSTALNGVYLDGGNLAVISSNSSQVVVDGSGQVATFGSGNVEIIPTSRPLNITIIANEGPRTHFSGRTLDSVVINPGGHLYGNFTTPNVANTGTLEPGTPTAIGTCVSTGDAYHTSEATLQIKIDPAGNTDQYLVGGALYLTGGTLTILPENGTYTEGTVYTFLWTEGGVVGAFNTITPVPGLDFALNYHLHSIDIVIRNTSTI